jgi:hypothetical protein
MTVVLSVNGGGGGLPFIDAPRIASFGHRIAAVLTAVRRETLYKTFILITTITISCKAKVVMTM